MAARDICVYADLRWNRQNGAAGIGVVLEEVLRRRPDTARVVSLMEGGGLGSPLSPLKIAARLPRRVAPEDVFWSPGFMPPAWSSMPMVVTVHDLIHLKYYTRYHRAYYDVILRRLYRRCEGIICVSDFTRSEFLDWSGMPESRVHTVYNGVSPEFFSAGGSSPYDFPYVLYMGNRRKYKNVERLIRAFSISTLPRDGFRLVLSGDADPELVSIARQGGVEEGLVFAGNVPQRDVPTLYAGASIVAMVSLSEGFGLPVLEAMASGVPVVTSNVSSLPEVAGGAAQLVDPFSIESICKGLETLAYSEEERERCRAQGLARARMFNWDATARKVWDLLARQ